MAYLQLYQGYYTGGTPTVLSANPFDVAQDLSTGNLWQYNGAAWVAPSWNSAITFYLGGAQTVCERINSENTKYPDTIQLYPGDSELVPADIRLSPNDLAVKHDLGNYSVQVGVFRRDMVSDTVVAVPFPAGEIISTEDGNWTLLKNLTQYVGFDYCTIALTWTSIGGELGPQVLDFVTSAQVQDMIDSAIGSVSGVLSSGAEIDTQVGEARFRLTSGGVTVQYGEALPKTWSITASGLSYIDVYDENNKSATISVGGAGNIDIICNDYDLGGYTLSLSTQGLYLQGDVGYSIVGEFTGLHIGNPIWLTDTLVFSSIAGSGSAVAVDLVSNTDLAITGGSHIWFNGEPLLTSADLPPAPPQTVEVVDSTSTSAYIPVLSGGICYRFTQPLTALRIGSVTSSLDETSILFTAGAVITPPVSINVGYRRTCYFEWDDELWEYTQVDIVEDFPLVSSGGGYAPCAVGSRLWYDFGGTDDHGEELYDYYHSVLSNGSFTCTSSGGVWIISAVGVSQYFSNTIYDFNGDEWEPVEDVSTTVIDGAVASSTDLLHWTRIYTASAITAGWVNDQSGETEFSNEHANVNTEMAITPCDVILPTATLLVNSHAVIVSSGTSYEMSIKYGAIVTGKWEKKR